eukprot:scaffold314927_cov21-Tisochrysis_lutea.AAC.2
MPGGRMIVAWLSCLLIMNCKCSHVTVPWYLKPTDKCSWYKRKSVQKCPSPFSKMSSKKHPGDIL